MDEQYVAIMTGLPLFKGYTPDGARRLLSNGEICKASPGEVLFKEGDPPAFVLLVLAGKLEVFVERNGREMALTDSGPSAILGELAVLCGTPRSASVRVVDESTVLKWDAESFRELLIRDVFLSQRIFRRALRTLLDKEQSLIASLSELQGEATPAKSVDA